MALLGRLYLRQARRAFSGAAAAQNQVAVVLSGCGVYDGSEIHEASALLVHLSRQGAKVAMFAPDVPQMHVIDHCKGEPSPGQTRNVLEESARIARGAVAPLSSLAVANFDAVVFPGGFGAAKNLSSFATDGAEMSVHVEVKRVLEEFNQLRKPIGLCCISPVLGARVLAGVELTVGREDDPAATAITAMGATHVPASVSEAHTDARQLVVSTPAFMYGEAPIHEVFDGIGVLVARVLSLVK